jgi:hypothetical protein
MDRKFLEFWGNFLLNAAKGQEQAESLNRMVREGFKTFEQQLSLFEKFYGLDKKPDPSTPYAEMWAKASTDFAKSYQEFLGLMGTVPREDYEALAREHEALKKKAADLEEALRRGKKKTGSGEADPSEVVKGFEGLMQKQTEQFQALVASYGKLYEAQKPGKDSTNTAPPEKPSRRGKRG